jgi:hypothetical protein
MRTLCLLALLLAAATPARADESSAATYAIVVGSNAGGPGQTDLRYAEDDARRVGKLLVDLGGYKDDQVDIVVHPTPAQLLTQITRLSDKLEADKVDGKQSRVFFYYSGHARAEALDLGKEQLALAELRSKLFALPTQLTVVVLDACQSGAFSRVKGATPAADFSFNSRQQLDATGIAVLASSSGSELSQESDQLKSSYFTHHLLVGMRGASDANRDGLVTIDEAYRYAYHQTLLATAETAVGGQHVSLEVDLKGHGEVPLAFPRAATAHIELPGTLEGRTLVEDKKSNTVIAETYKAKGAAVRIAVAPGEYRVLVRHPTSLSRCEVVAGDTIDLSRCTTEALVATRGKGDGVIDGNGRFRRPYRLELLGHIGPDRETAYTRTLEDFGYEPEFIPLGAGMTLSGLKRYSRYLWIGGAVGFHDLPTWQRNGGDYPMRFESSLYTLMAVGRAEAPITRTGVGSRVKFYAQLAAGLGYGRTQLSAEQSGMTTRDGHVGLATSLGAGILIGGDDNNVWFKGLGLSFGYQLDYAPVIGNLVGDTHAAGGHHVTAAASYSF